MDFFFQVVYCTKEKESIWTSEWGFTAIFNCFSSANTSVCMLFKITFNSKESDNILIKKGDLLLMIDVKTDNKVITLGKNVPLIKTSLPWKKPLPKTSVLPRKFAKKLIRSSSKRKASSPVKRQEKWLSEDIFSNVQVNWENTYQLLLIKSIPI